mmetsp:Transcript_5102/g.14361  ORF Transcript_5102/g.14361 Transcript_5102/m.14361 type:complete len:154 (-) Transcript_5102:171-632(-)
MPKNSQKDATDDTASQASDANSIPTDQICTLKQDQEKILAMLLDERKQRQALEATQTDNATVHSNFPNSPGTFATTGSQELLESQAILTKSMASLADRSSQEKEDNDHVKWDTSSFLDYTDSKYTIKFLPNFLDHARTHHVADILDDDYEVPD